VGGGPGGTTTVGLVAIAAGTVEPAPVEPAAVEPAPVEPAAADAAAVEDEAVWPEGAEDAPVGTGGADRSAFELAHPATIKASTIKAGARRRIGILSVAAAGHTVRQRRALCASSQD
jgi:hypothetical protein